MKLICKMFGHVYVFTGYNLEAPKGHVPEGGGLDQLKCCKCGIEAITSLTTMGAGEGLVVHDDELNALFARHIKERNPLKNTETENHLVIPHKRQVYNNIMKVIFPFTKPSQGYF